MAYESYWKSTPQTWERLKDAARKNRKAPTKAEALLWGKLRSGRLDGLKFRRQHAIGPYIADFYCAAARLVIEVDGPIHEHQEDEDEVRAKFFEAMGLSVARFTSQRVIEHPQDVLSSIRSVVARSPSP